MEHFILTDTICLTISLVGPGMFKEPPEAVDGCMPRSHLSDRERRDGGQLGRFPVGGPVQGSHPALL